MCRGWGQNHVRCPGVGVLLFNKTVFGISEGGLTLPNFPRTIVGENFAPIEIHQTPVR